MFNQAEVANLTKKEMEAYDESQKVYWDNYAVLESTKKIAAQEGREEGREEERLAIALSMKKKNIPIDIIAETTKLSKEQIEEL